MEITIVIFIKIDFQFWCIIKIKVFGRKDKKDKMENQKSFWKTDAFIILALVVFWPIGLFLVWKYASWRKWVKGLLTAFFLISAIPLLLIWSLLFGLKGYSFIRDFTNPRIVNQSKLYNCVVLSSEWGKCTSTKYNFSFEYPVKWYWIDLRPEGIGFSDKQENIKESWLISISSPHEYDSERAKENLPKLSGNTVVTIHGMWAVRHEPQSYDIIGPKVSFVKNNIMYDIELWKENIDKRNFSAEEKKQISDIFEHVVDSFRFE